MRWMSRAVVVLTVLTTARPALAAPTVVGPPLLEKPAGAHDRYRYRFVLFGGRDTSQALRPKTWEWDGVVTPGRRSPVAAPARAITTPWPTT
jgi:hypothetical protein